MRAILHCRVSTKEQEETGYSLEAQEKLLKEYAQAKGFQIARIFRVSESASGKQIRKMFNEMLEYADKEKILVICCEKIDRLTRNIKDADTVNDWVLDGKDRQVHFLKENFILSRDTRAHENLVWDMKVAIARFYTNNLSEEVKKGQKEKLAQGWRPSKAPLGYKTVGEAGRKIHVPHEQKARFIQRAFELYAAGNYSTRKLTEVMYNEGLRNHNGRKVVKSHMHRLLSDPFYCGKMRWNGEVLSAEHTPIISKSLFNAVQKKLARKTASPQFRKHFPVFKAKITCKGCGGLITWETHKGHWYGHCNHYRNCQQKKWWRQEKVEEILFYYFEKIAPKTERVLKAINDALESINTSESEYQAQTVSELQGNLTKIRNRLEAIYEDKIDGKISIAFYERKFKEYTEDEEAILEQLKQLTQDGAKYYQAGVAIHELAFRAREIYSSPKATTEERRALLSLIFSNLTINAENIRMEYTLAFQFLAEWVPILNDQFKPEKSLDNKGQNASFDINCPTMLAFNTAFRTYSWPKSINDLKSFNQQIDNLLSICTPDSDDTEPFPHLN